MMQQLTAAVLKCADEDDNDVGDHIHTEKEVENRTEIDAYNASHKCFNLSRNKVPQFRFQI